MEPSKLYIIDENTLKHLLARDKELTYLECSGVDNWSWYGEGREEFLLDAIGNRISKEDINNNEIDFEFVAKLDLKKYPTFIINN